MWPAEDDQVRLFRDLPWVLVPKSSKGHRCTGCNRLLKIYNRRLTASITAGMIRLFVLMQNNPGSKYHHIRNLGVSRNGGEFAQARWWGFSEEAPKDKEKDTRTSGMWTLTPYGVQFLTLKVQVPTYVVTRWCSEHIGFSGMLIDARTAVEHRNKFSYAELMKGPFLPPQAGGS